MPTEAKWGISLAIGLGLLWLGWKFYLVLVLLHIMICGVLIVVVLLQSGEAADLAGAFGGAGSQTAFGPRGAATFFTKATTWCAVMFMLTSMALTMHQDTAAGVTGRSVLQQFSKNPAAPLPAAKTAPGTPAPVPAPAQSVPVAPAAPAPAQSAPAQSAPATPAQPQSK